MTTKKMVSDTISSWFGWRARRKWCLTPLFFLVGGCGFPQPEVRVTGAMPVELPYRAAKGGLVVVTGRVNGRADVGFILDTGAPVTVLLDGKRTAALGLDSSKARRLGPEDNPAAPIGDIQGGFHLDFGGVQLARLTAVVVPEATMPCRERFDEIAFGGVIGADLFRRFVVEIDPKAARIRLHEPATWRAGPGLASLPLTFRDGHPFVPATVRLAGGARIATPLNVDTGMNRALTLVAGEDSAFAMPAEGPVRKSCFVNGTREEREGPAVQVEVGGVTLPVERPIYSSHRNPVSDGRSGTLGAAAFHGRRIAIDYPGRRIFMEVTLPPATGG